MPGHLFTEYFLTEGIRATPEWRESVASADAFESFRDGLRERYEALSLTVDPNEAVTEQELIRPVLELLGWADYLPQQGAARNEDIPDHLLFPDADSKARAAAKGRAEERFSDALVVEESKRFGLPLEARDMDVGNRSRTAHGQILRYLSTAESETDGAPPSRRPYSRPNTRCTLESTTATGLPCAKESTALIAGHPSPRECVAAGSDASLGVRPRFRTEPLTWLMGCRGPTNVLTRRLMASDFRFVWPLVDACNLSG